MTWAKVGAAASTTQMAASITGAVAGLALHRAFIAGKTQLLGRPLRADPRGVWLYAGLGLCAIAAQMCLIGSMGYMPVTVTVTVTAMLTLCTPVLVFPLGYWLFKDQDAITFATLLGTALTVAGMAIIVLR